jgi:hypothetical protein
MVTSNMARGTPGLRDCECRRSWFVDGFGHYGGHSRYDYLESDWSHRASDGNERDRHSLAQHPSAIACKELEVSALPTSDFRNADLRSGEI